MGSNVMSLEFLNKQLINASKWGDLECCKKLIDQGDGDLDLNKAMSRVTSSLCQNHTTRNGYESIVKLLLEKGANNFNECMVWATYYDHKNIVMLMLTHGADNYNDSMAWVARNGHEDIMRLMLKKGAGYLDYNYAMWRAEQYNEVVIVKLLLNHGVDINTLTSNKLKDKIIKESREERNNLKMVLEHIIGDPSFAILMSNELIKIYD